MPNGEHEGFRALYVFMTSWFIKLTIDDFPPGPGFFVSCDIIFTEHGTEAGNPGENRSP